MDLTIDTAHDLIRIINAYPQWRKQVRESLFPEINLPKAFQELAEAQREMKLSVSELSQNVSELSQTVNELRQAQRNTERMVQTLVQTQKEMADDIRKLQLVTKHHTTRLARIDKKLVEAAQERQALRDDLEIVKRGQKDLKRGQEDLRRDLGELRHNQNGLRGEVYEGKIRDRADAIFGYFLRRGRKMRNEIAAHLLEAEEKGQISPEEHEQVLASDLLWGGKLKNSKEDLFLVLEVSWQAEENDLERAYNRANILRSIGFECLPVVAAMNWTPELAKEALDLGIVMVTNMRLDKASWQVALDPMV